MSIVENITKGDWHYEDDNGCKEIFADNEKSSIATAFTHGLENDPEDLANAQLIADAGTTANKCGLLPSEILEQRNELLEAIKNLKINYINHCDKPSTRLVLEVNALIEKYN